MVTIKLTFDAESFADIIENHPTLASKIDELILSNHCVYWSEETKPDKEV